MAVEIFRYHIPWPVGSVGPTLLAWMLPVSRRKSGWDGLVQYSGQMMWAEWARILMYGNIAALIEVKTSSKPLQNVLRG